MIQLLLASDLYMICLSFAILVCCLQQMFSGQIAAIRSVLPLTLICGLFLFITCLRFVQCWLTVLRTLHPS